MRAVEYLDATHQTRFLGARRGHDHAAHTPRTRGQDSRQHPAHRLDTPVQRKLTNEDRVFKSHRRDKACTER